MPDLNAQVENQPPGAMDGIEVAVLNSEEKSDKPKGVQSKIEETPNGEDTVMVCETESSLTE